MSSFVDLFINTIRSFKDATWGHGKQTNQQTYRLIGGSISRPDGGIANIITDYVQPSAGNNYAGSFLVELQNGGYDAFTVNPQGAILINGFVKLGVNDVLGSGNPQYALYLPNGNTKFYPGQALGITGLGTDNEGFPYAALNPISAAPGLSIISFGADPTGATDSTAAINAAIAAVPYGGTLWIPQGTFKVSGAGTANASGDGTSLFQITSGLPITIRGEGRGSRLVVQSNVSATTDIIHVAPSSAVTGNVFRDFAIVTQGGYGVGYGRHAIHIDGWIGQSSVYETIIDNMSIWPTLGGASIRSYGPNTNLTGVLAYSMISNCDLESIDLVNVGDTVEIYNNTIVGGTNIGIYAQQVGGAGGLGIVHNTIGLKTNTHIYIDSGIPRIERNTLELVSDSTAPNKALIELAGITSSILNPILRDNQLQISATGTNVPIRLGNTTNPHIAGGRVNVHSTNNMVVITSGTFDALIEAGIQWCIDNVAQNTPVLSDSGTRTRYTNRFVTAN